MKVSLITACFRSADVIRTALESVLAVATVFGVISMGVYLVHPLVTRGLSIVVTRFIQPPYSVWIVLAEWIVAWTVSLGATYVLRRMPIAWRFV